MTCYSLGSKYTNTDTQMPLANIGRFSGLALHQTTVAIIKMDLSEDAQEQKKLIHLHLNPRGKIPHYGILRVGEEYQDSSVNRLRGRTHGLIHAGQYLPFSRAQQTLGLTTERAII